ncbi:MULTISPECIES: hypothetical protein [Bacillati]|uniref:hypothetical protein n=1 Tax=Bacillati TaxID=1783272 RepID=UPI0022B9B55B|nr:hypothetical protein [Caldifermentibacillus hisashii]
MDIITKKVSSDELGYPFFKTRDDEIPFWDHPFLKASKVLPKKYYPYTTQEGVIDLYRRGILDENDITLLKVLGDAVCANEDQLRRYMISIMSRSDTSKRLDRFRTNGLVDRWKIRIHSDTEEIVKPPAPFTLGIAGFKLLKHYYSADFFMNPNLWDNYGVGGIKRYVAMNELRCVMTEKKIAKKWKWNAVIADNPKLKFPMGAAELRVTDSMNINFMIDRAQMNQNFLGYFRDKLDCWKKVYEANDNRIPITGFPDENESYVIIYTSTYTLAKYIHDNLMLDTYPFPIWLCVEEDLLKDGLNTSFYIPQKDKLQRIQLNF